MNAGAAGDVDEKQRNFIPLMLQQSFYLTTPTCSDEAILNGGGWLTRLRSQ